MGGRKCRLLLNVVATHVIFFFFGLLGDKSESSQAQSPAAQDQGSHKAFNRLKWGEETLTTER